MKKSILFVLIFCSTWVNAQTLLERTVDSVSIKERHEFILSKLDSAFIFDNDKLEFVRPFEPENCVVYDTYNCHKGPGGIISTMKNPLLTLTCSPRIIL